MSAIDSYLHKCIGVVNCPFSFEKTHGLTYKEIPIYRLQEDIPKDEEYFDGKIGDILVGGGSGESVAFRISIPEAFLLYTHDDWDYFDNLSEIYKNFWSATEAYVFGDGYRKLGWHPSRDMEVWLLEHVLAFLENNYFDEYKEFIGNEELDCDGSICRLPSEEELGY